MALLGCDPRRTVKESVRTFVVKVKMMKLLSLVLILGESDCEGIKDVEVICVRKMKVLKWEEAPTVYGMRTFVSNAHLRYLSTLGDYILGETRTIRYIRSSTSSGHLRFKNSSFSEYQGTIMTGRF